MSIQNRLKPSNLPIVRTREDSLGPGQIIEALRRTAQVGFGRRHRPEDRIEGVVVAKLGACSVARDIAAVALSPLAKDGFAVG